jgi:hypothetical protein
MAGPRHLVRRNLPDFARQEKVMAFTSIQYKYVLVRRWCRCRCWCMQLSIRIVEYYLMVVRKEGAADGMDGCCSARRLPTSTQVCPEGRKLDFDARYGIWSTGLYTVYSSEGISFLVSSYDLANPQSPDSRWLVEQQTSTFFNIQSCKWFFFFWNLSDLDSHFFVSFDDIDHIMQTSIQAG